jgi:ADP-ribose pyrophosphatase
MSRSTSLKPWKIISSTTAFDHPWFGVRQDTVELPNGKVLNDWMLWISPEVSLIVPMTPDGDLVLVRQYKHGVEKIIWEFPAGFVDKGEDSQSAAVRELLEETNLVASKIEPLGVFMNHPTKETGNLHIFFASNVVPSNAKPFVDDLVQIEVAQFKPKQVLNMIMTGDIFVTGSVSAFFLASQKYFKI